MYASAEKQGRQLPGPDAFQRDWLDACKGKSNSVVNGTSSKTHCDFDYAGTMIEQMLLGLVAHRAGKTARVRCGEWPGHQRGGS